MDTYRQQVLSNQQRFGNPHGKPAPGWCPMCREDGPNELGGNACDHCLNAESD